MDANLTTGTSSFLLVAKGLIALHRLIKDGKDDSPEAESIRDALDAPLNVLGRVEKERVQWLSEDLYSISDPPSTPAPIEMNPQAQRGLIQAIEARENREWDRALSLLRGWKDFISPVLLSYLRGEIWLKAGYPEIASVFFRHASDNDRSDSNFRASYLESLAKSEPEAAKKLAGEVLSADERHGPVMVAQAATLRFDDARNTSDAESVQQYRDLIPILERTMTRIEQDDSTGSRKAVSSMMTWLLGRCHEFLGNAGAAIDAYTRGLLIDPDNDALLIARGVLRYDSSRRAINDFERAARNGSSLVWPYLFLAHHSLNTRRYEQCRSLCEAGLMKKGSDAARSQLNDWLAISQAELGFPADFIRSAFEAAVRLDPSNELARRNRDAFEDSLKRPHANPHSRWEQKSEAAVRQFALAERRAA